jgi:hypothetical protein
MSECNMCKEPCDFLEKALMADDICQCCRRLAATLYPTYQTSTLNAHNIMTYTTTDPGN